MSVLFFLAATIAQAGVPNRIIYQGRLSKKGVSVYGNHTFVARILAADGTQLWSSGNMAVSLPVTGDFSLVLEPTDIDWVNQTPLIEISVDGEKLNPADSLASSPYSFVSSFATTVSDGAINNAKLSDSCVSTTKLADGSVTATKTSDVIGQAIDTSRIQLKDTDQFVTVWQSTEPANRHKIRGEMVLGNISPATHATTHRPLAHGGSGGDDLQLHPSQIDNTALVARSALTQTIEPSANVLPLVIKPKTGSNPASVHILDLQDEGGNSKVFVSGNGNVGIGTSNPTAKLQVAGDISFPNTTVIRAEKTTSQIISNDTVTPVVFNTEQDSLGEFNAASGVFQPQASGWYQISAHINWNVGTTSDFYQRVFIYRNNVLYSQSWAAASTLHQSQELTDLVYLNSGDSVDIRVNSNKGSDDAIVGGTYVLISRVTGR